MLKTYIEKLMQKKDLTAAEVTNAINEILHTRNIPQTAAFMTLLKAKGETVEEILSIVKVMQEKMIEVPITTPVLDIVGTGGDGANTINISTGSAILAASCGVKVAKHGNRSVSSHCGSADVLEKLGVNIHMTPQEIASCIEDIGIGFCYAPLFHPVMKELKKIRTELAIPTTFNIMGPLLNPARAKFLMIGVSNKKMLNIMANVLIKMNVSHAMVFHGSGIDEITTAAPIDVIEILSSKKNKFVLHPKNFGFPSCSIDDLKGGNPNENATILKEALSGKAGPVADTFIFNAGIAACLYGITQSIEDGIKIAKQKIATGEAISLLNQFITVSEKHYA